jgi:hypothetical protein
MTKAATTHLGLPDKEEINQNLLANSSTSLHTDPIIE